MTLATSSIATQYARAIHGWAYVTLAFWSLMLFIFTIARLVYTLSPRTDRFLNNGRPFYESTVMELVVCAIFGMAWSGVMIFVLRAQQSLAFVSTNGFEIGMLTLFWFLWIGGAASATTIWPTLNFCVQFSTCQVLQAMMAWAWLGWITITLLLFTSLFFAIRTRRWQAQLPNSWELENRTTPGFTIDGEERNSGAKMETRDLGKAAEEGNIDPNAYEFERWKRAVDWLHEENPNFAKEAAVRDPRAGASTSAV